MEESIPPAATVRPASQTLMRALAATVVVAGLIGLVTWPMASSLGASRYMIPSALHGAIAFLYLIVATFAAYFASRMYVGRLPELHHLRVLSTLCACLSLLAVVFGNLIYIYFPETGGPRPYFLEESAAVHEVFVESKQLLALFSVPLAVAAAYILLREHDGLLERPRMRRAVAVLLVLQWGLLLLVFALGTAMASLRAA